MNIFSKQNQICLFSFHYILQRAKWTVNSWGTAYQTQAIPLKIFVLSNSAFSTATFWILHEISIENSILYNVWTTSHPVLFNMYDHEIPIHLFCNGNKRRTRRNPRQLKQNKKIKKKNMTVLELIWICFRFWMMKLLTFLSFATITWGWKVATG